jgi:hypothetical protein
MFVCPHVTTRDPLFMKLYAGELHYNFFYTFEFWLQSDKSNGHFTCRLGPAFVSGREMIGSGILRRPQLPYLLLLRWLRGELQRGESPASVPTTWWSPPLWRNTQPGRRQTPHPHQGHRPLKLRPTMALLVNVKGQILTNATKLLRCAHISQLASFVRVDLFHCTLNMGIYYILLILYFPFILILLLLVTY